MKSRVRLNKLDPSIPLPGPPQSLIALFRVVFLSLQLQEFPLELFLSFTTLGTANQPAFVAAPYQKVNRTNKPNTRAHAWKEPSINEGPSQKPAWVPSFSMARRAKDSLSPAKRKRQLSYWGHMGVDQYCWPPKNPWVTFPI